MRHFKTILILILAALLLCGAGWYAFQKVQLVSPDGELISSENPLSISNYGEFRLNVAMGRLPGYSFINKFAENPSIDTGTDPEDIWDFGGLYTWTVDAGASYFISSSDNADNQSVVFQGITVDSNNNWNDESVTQLVPGQTETQLISLSGDPFKMIYRIESMAVTGDDIAGMLYVYEDDTVVAGVPQTQTLVRGQVNDGNNQTLMSQYAVPTGKVAFFFQILAGQSRAQTAGQSRLSILTARYGEVFKVKGRIATVNSGSSNFTNNLTFPAPIPSRTSVVLRVEEVSANSTGIYAIYDILLVDEELFTDEYLAAIGQVKRVP